MLQQTGSCWPVESPWFWMEHLAQGMRQTDTCSLEQRLSHTPALWNFTFDLFCVDYSFIIQDVQKKIAMPDWAEELLNCLILSRINQSDYSRGQLLPQHIILSSISGVDIFLLRLNNDSVLWRVHPLKAATRFYGSSHICYTLKMSPWLFDGMLAEYQELMFQSILN